MRGFLLPALTLLLLAQIACGQKQPAATPQASASEQPTAPAPAQTPGVKVDLPFPPPVQGKTDAKEWKLREFGTPPLAIDAPVKLVSTGDRVPENARAYIARNETWSAANAQDLQVVVNAVEYNAGVPLQTEAIARFAAEDFRQDVAVSDLAMKESPLQVPGASEALRIDGRLFRDGMVHYWCIATFREGQRVWQVSIIYPEVHAMGPGDVEAILASLRVKG
jgi:hypothetical protein